MPGLSSPQGNDMDIDKTVEIPSSRNDIKNSKIQFENDRSNHYKTFYLKLHGSQNWTFNGNSMMVIGYNKKEKIASDKFLSWYLDIFSEILNMDETKLMIIGYSFKDEHINEAISTSNCKLYIINPLDRKMFTKTLLKQPSGKKIKNQLHNYYQRTIGELFPSDAQKNHHPDWNNIKTNFFDEEE